MGAKSFPDKTIFSCLACPAFRVDCVALKQTALSLGSLHSLPKFLFELEKRTFDSNLVGKGCVIPRAFHATFPNDIWATRCNMRVAVESLCRSAHVAVVSRPW